jgi:hypothetical protein
MTNVPHTWAEARELGLKGLWLYARVRMAFLVIGIVGAVAVQLLTGFWGFREKHQVLITSQYQATMLADKKFEEERRSFEAVFAGVPPEDPVAYKEAARDYIQTVEALQNLLPSSQQEYEAYVEAIAGLQKFYGTTQAPLPGTLESTIFFGEYRLALDAYLVSRDAYLSKVAEEAGSYVRYLRNS